MSIKPINADDIKAYGISIGYIFDDLDCDEIMRTSYDGETTEDAVEDFLNAFER